MKVRERDQVRQLRRRGLSYTQIREIVPVSRSSISVWTRDIDLTPEQLGDLTSHSRGREKYAETRRRQREAREAAVSAQAQAEYADLCSNPDFMYGLALYVGEGTKATRGRVLLSNCDPRVLKRFISFLALLGVATTDLRARVYLHPHLSQGEALGFWSSVTGIAPSRFGKTATSLSRASKGLRPDSQPYGTSTVYYESMRVWLKLRTWMDLSLS
jgi:hypothetical protein